MSNKKLKWYDPIVVFLFKALLVIGVIGFFYFFIGACIGNFFNVDEDPAPGLHWKP